MKTRVVILGLLVVGSLFAIPIPTLFNSGVNGAGALLVGGNGTTDTHWTVQSGPGLGSPVSATTYFNGAYFADGPSSRWISVNSSGFTGASGNYVFRTTFDLTGFNLALTSLSF